MKQANGKNLIETNNVPIQVYEESGTSQNTLHVLCDLTVPKKEWDPRVMHGSVKSHSACGCSDLLMEATELLSLH